MWLEGGKRSGVVFCHVQSGGQDATSASVLQSDSGSNPGGGDSSNTSPSSSNNTSSNGSSDSGKAKKSGFPVWAGALIAVLVILVVAVVASYVIWRKCAARREMRKQEQFADGTFPHTMCAPHTRTTTITHSCTVNLNHCRHPGPRSLLEMSWL